MNKISVRIKYGDIVYEVEGSTEEVLTDIIRWINNIIPTFNLAKRLLIDIDYQKLIESISKYGGLTSDGDILIYSEHNKSLSLSNKILILLSLRHIQYKFGYVDEEALPLNMIARKLSSSNKTTSSRLSELYSQGYVSKDRRNGSVAYKITMKGLLKVLSL